ncbi:ABC transporter permease [Microbacterium saperdae]
MSLDVTAGAAASADLGIGRIGRMLATTASALLLIVLAAAAVAPHLLTDADPASTDYASILQSPSSAHPLGTDQLGRDLYTRLVFGARSSLAIGLGATLIGLALGGVIAVAALLGPRFIDATLMRLTDVGMAFPEILLALIVIAVLGPGPINAAVAIGIGSAPGYARLLRAQARVVQSSLFVEAARGLGVHPLVIAGRHIIPNAMGPVIVLATISAGTNIILAAGLSFLGFGTPPPGAEWGLMLAEGRNVLAQAWWLTLFPGALITAVVVSVTVIGRALESRLGGA